MTHRGHILVVDDEKDIRELIQDILEDEGFQVTTAANGVQARDAWRRGAPDIVFLDVWMPDIDGISLLRQMKEEGLLAHTNVVMISGHGTIETAVEATRLGAWDFLEKPLSLNRLLVATERALKHLRLARRNPHGQQLPGWDIDLIGKSRAMQALRADAERLARYTMPVLVLGERGSGRHQFARAVHNLSPRKDHPLEVLDAQQLNNDPTRWLGSVESKQVRVGELSRLAGGSLIIDDIHLLSPELQNTL
ncbi:MAG TPA: sigma-54-dependent Fis family transcriptional regulator, partial [Piscirickettsiaceae bacterium]|nr:sigma-54-dependent Fis family transcriptional regulator [Piscirickettsiaceae bacterium]